VAVGTLTAVKDYYEELWQRLPDELAAPDLELRRGFLLAEVRSGDRALDLGCGAGEFTAVLSQAGARAIGVDVAQAALARARREHPAGNFRLAPVDGSLPLADNSFELVCASEVVEDVADTATWLSEVRRVLVPAGRLLLTTPNHGRLRLALRGVEPFSEPLGDHLHLYTARSLRALLTQFGFTDVGIRSAAGPPLLRRLLMARAVR
jgi:ubiquinone/menaquinone biosynthesis C-methylase UbiE